MAEVLHVTREHIDRVAETYGFPRSLVDSAVRHGRIVIANEVDDGNKNKNRN